MKPLQWTIWNRQVALRKESVDRNMICLPRGTVSHVALRKESVDRNIIGCPMQKNSGVALRKESVDRNLLRKITITVDDGRSPQGERG